MAHTFTCLSPVPFGVGCSHPQTMLGNISDQTQQKGKELDYSAGISTTYAP